MNDENPGDAREQHGTHEIHRTHRGDRGGDRGYPRMNELVAMKPRDLQNIHGNRQINETHMIRLENHEDAHEDHEIIQVDVEAAGTSFEMSMLTDLPCR